MGKFLLGALTVEAADVVLTSEIPTTAEAEAILASTVSAEQLDKINRATTMLQTFFAVRKQLKTNKAKIDSVATGIIPSDIITKNNALLSKTDTILSSAYVANGKQLLPFQDPTDVPLIKEDNVAGSFGALTSGNLTEKEVIEIENQTADITKAINDSISNPAISIVKPPSIVQQNNTDSNKKMIVLGVAGILFIAAVSYMNRKK